MYIFHYSAIIGIRDNSPWTLELKILLSIKWNIFLIKTTFLVFIRRGRKFIMLAKNVFYGRYLQSEWINWGLKNSETQNILCNKIGFRDTSNVHFVIVHFVIVVFVVAISEIEYDWNPQGGILRNYWRYKKHVDKSFYFRIWLI